jgi:class 3 adenylate cyclase
MGVPTGTVTFLFTDIEGSTRLWEGHPGEMRAAVERHDQILRSIVGQHRGYVFSTGGDAFCVAFGRAGDAVAAAASAQRELDMEAWPAPTPVRVRMGLHTGEAQERDGDYFGPALNRAARIMSAGHGGQVLVSGATAAVVDELPADLKLVDLGSHRLRDLSGPVSLWLLGGAGLADDAGSLRVADAVPGNLPTMLTSLVGRETEIAAVEELLEGHRLVTVVGPGGMGKTRLRDRSRCSSGSPCERVIWNGVGL